MAPQYPNMYQRARKVTLLTQEEAAERLGISAETLKRYEGGRLTPSDETVAKMCSVYGVPWLALEHAKATDRLGVLPEVEPKPLPMATISLTNRLRETIAAAYQVIYADAKKERPEAGTSKRSRPQSRSSENYCKHSISQKQTNVNTFRGEARA